MPDTLPVEALAGPSTRRVRGGAIELAGCSAAVGRTQALLQRAALLDTGVLIVAERGVEVESVARELHSDGRSPAAPLITVGCADDASTIDRALFGAPGMSRATDLVAVSPESAVASARGGTLFLHDVAELPAAVQARLARLARDGEMFLNGQAVPTRCRLVASAPPTIERDVREHRFRPDLYRRIAASRIDLPPLRDRPEDIPALVARLVEEHRDEQGGPARRFTDAALAVMSALPWAGNLAELRSVIDRVLCQSTETVVQIEQVLPSLQLDRSMTAFLPAGTLREARLRFERDYIAAVLQYHGWKVAEAAQTLGIQRPNLYRKARQLGIPVNRIGG
jgi:DNA-binding NtrC family response regulator